MKNEINKKYSKSIFHEIDKIRMCDLILSNGEDRFVGLYYEYNSAMEAPVVLCKGLWNINNFFRSFLERNGILCVDNNLLGNEIFDSVEIGASIPKKLYKSMASYYSGIIKDEEREKAVNFIQRLNEDVLSQIHSLEKHECKRTAKRFLKSLEKNNEQSKNKSKKNFEERVMELVRQYEIDYRIIHNEVCKTDEIYLEYYMAEYDLDFWQMIFVSKEEGKIYFATRTLCYNFDIAEIEVVIGFINAMLETTKGSLKKHVTKYCEEFRMNSRLNEIAHNTITTIIEQNLKQPGIEYSYSFNTTVFSLYIFKPNDNNNSTMYEIVITYKEFLKNPGFFKSFIQNPEPLKKWNFWCKERKYNQKYFEEKNQAIEP